MLAVDGRHATGRPTHLRRGEEPLRDDGGVHTSIGRPLAVIIVNWEGIDVLPPCIEALRRQTRSPDEMIVVDNGSADGSLEWARQQADLTVVELGRNTGFAPAANTGIEQAGRADVLLLNNDVQADGRLVEHLLAQLDRAEPRFGFSTARLVRRHDRTIDAAGAFLDVAGVPGHRGMGDDMDAPQHLEPRTVPAACAAATLYRREMLEDIGLFAPSFFAYYEDADLSARAVLRGWRGAYVPEAIAWHEVSATSSRTPGLKQYYGMRNSWWLLIRCLPARLLGPTLVRHLAVHAVWIASAARRGHLRLALRAELDAVRGLRRALHERREIQSRRTASAAEFRRLQVPAQTPLLRRRLTRRRLTRRSRTS